MKTLLLLPLVVFFGCTFEEMIPDETTWHYYHTEGDGTSTTSFAGEYPISSRGSIDTKSDTFGVSATYYTGERYRSLKEKLKERPRPAKLERIRHHNGINHTHPGMGGGE